MTAADERAREYAAIQDDCEQLAIANAGLLVEVAELTAIVESVRAARTELYKNVNMAASLGSTSFRLGAEVAYRDCVDVLDQVEGL